MDSQRKRTILILDDDSMNLMIMDKTAREAGYEVRPFSSGEEALDHMKANPRDVDIALLDKMMPGLNGIEVLKQIKANPALRHIPVILQTGDVGVAQMCEGLKAGACYYLTKPYHPEMMASILSAAAAECTLRDELVAHMAADQTRIIGLLQEGEFAVKTHAEAQLVAVALSQTAQNPESTALGLMELLSNAIEHGNLDIGYEHKCKCMWMHSWEQELATRAELPEYRERVVRVSVHKKPGGLEIAITDGGMGFDWRQYMNHEIVGRLTDPNGRGLARAFGLLGDLRYMGPGNEVRCTVPTKQEEPQLYTPATPAYSTRPQ